MTRDELEHAIRAACDVADETDLVVFGSQAILGEYPDAPEALRQSTEVDVSPINRTDMVDSIDAVLGELSQFHKTHGFYVHGLPIEEAATLPGGWRDRTVLVQTEGTRRNKGHCLEAHDLAASKLVAFRQKDTDFVRTLIVEGLIDPTILVERIAALPLDDSAKVRLASWVRKTERDL